MSTAVATPQADFLVNSQGSVVLLVPLTPKAHNACEDGTINNEPWQWMGGGLTVDRRMFDDLQQSLEDDGYTFNQE